jgi:hypothetical protein
VYAWRMSKGKRWREFWLLYCEAVLVALLLVIPLLFAPLINLTNCTYDYDPCSKSAYQEYGSDHVSVWTWWWHSFHGFFVAYHDDINALSTLVIAAFTAALAWSTVKLWRETERLAKGADDQSEKMRESIREQRRTAFAALLSAKAAKKTAAAVDLQAKAAVGAETPLLQITDIFISHQVDGKEKWIRKFEPAVTIKNFGRAPAVVTEVIMNIGFGYIPDRPPELIRYHTYPVAAVVESGKEFKYYDMWLKKGITEQQINVFLADEAMNAFVFGVIKYRDFSGIHDQGFVFIWIKDNWAFSPFDQKTAYYIQT